MNPSLIPSEVRQALPQDAASIAALAGQLASLAVDRAADQHAADAASLSAAVAARGAEASELHQINAELREECSALTIDLAQAHTECERLSGEKEALASTVKQLADKVRKLEGLKRMLLSNLAEEGAPQASLLEEPPDGESLLGSVLQAAKPLVLPPRPSLVAANARQPSMLGGAHSANGGSAAPAASSAGAVASASLQGSAASAPAGGAATSRVDGKEFFKLARQRLPYDGFHAFLQVIKDLNAGKQSRDEAVARARVIFGSDNADLDDGFQGLLVRHLKPA